MSTTLDPAHVAWCRSHFDLLTDGGTWGIPRSGLLFQRRGDKLALVKRMEHEPGMPITPEALAAEQQADYEATRDHFVAAGVEVEDLSNGSRPIGAIESPHRSPSDARVFVPRPEGEDDGVLPDGSRRAAARRP